MPKIWRFITLNGRVQIDVMYRVRPLSNIFVECDLLNHFDGYAVAFSFRISFDKI